MCEQQTITRLIARDPVSIAHSIFYDHPVRTETSSQSTGASDNGYMPAKVRNLPQKNPDTQGTGQVGQALLVLQLTRTGGPFLLANHVAEKM